MKRTVLIISFLVVFCWGYSQTGRVGIGTATPQARLHVADSSVLFSAPGGVAVAPGTPPGSGLGRKMMWWVDKAAFRTGFVNNTFWDRDSIGNVSFAAGFNTKARGDFSNSFGYYNSSSAEASTSFGEYNMANGAASLVSGINNQAYGLYSFATGQISYAGNTAATAMGYRDTATGASSMALGSSLYARSYGEMAIGSYNTDFQPVTPLGINLTDRIFSVGNGSGPSGRNNALTIYRNGNIAIGITNPFSQFANTDKNIIGSDGVGGNTNSLSWVANQPNYAAQIFNSYTTSSANGLAVKVTSTAGTALDVSQGSQETPGTPLLTVKSSGNVGIGVLIPTQKLDVNGAVKATAVTTAQTGTANMLAAAYGAVASNAVSAFTSSSGNCILSHTTIGVYIITFTGSSLSNTNIENLSTVTSLQGNTPGFISHTGITGSITIYTFDSSGAPVDRSFGFALYKP